MRRTVTNFLDRSAAHASARLSLGAGRSIVIWENQNDRVYYDEPLGHTFSFYLRGGCGTRRLDGGANSGWPGAVCVMPAGLSSDWVITTPIQFVHFYFPDSTLRASYARIHDCDARRLDVPEATFDQSPGIAQPLAQMARAASEEDILLAETAVAELIGGLPNGAVALKGGLSPIQLRRTDEWIDANLEGTIRLVDLATESGLSEFHFHRMFCLSRGVSPHKWVVIRRIEVAKNQLGGCCTIAEIAAACEFASQSHLTRFFKTEVGATPAHYRAMLQT
ncbi:MAG: helix-turn-helix transcriptional regulator [Rhodobacteraceae bacterium]|nr:helix-turn-helix transcriptional regulator [Paracoccaceae bacterium]